MECKCGNKDMGFDCTCQWVEDHPGDIDFCCIYCGIYTADKPRCNECVVNPSEKGLPRS